MHGRITLNVMDTGKRTMVCTFCERFLLVFALLLVTLGCQPAKEEPAVEDDVSVTSNDDRQTPDLIAGGPFTRG